MTDLQAAYEVREYLCRLGVKADVEPITLRYRDLTATIGYEVVVTVPPRGEGADGVRAARQDDLGSEPPV